MKVKVKVKVKAKVKVRKGNEGTCDKYIHIRTYVPNGKRRKKEGRNELKS